MKPAVRDVAFAMAFAEDAPLLERNVVAVSWTPEALKVLKHVREEATSRASKGDDDAYIHLPYADLRAHLHLEIDDWAAIQDDGGLRSPYVPVSGNPEPWGFIAGGEARSAVQKIKDAFARWSEGTLAAYCANRGLDTLSIAALRRLNQQDQVVRVSPSRVQIFPWGAITKLGTPTPFDVTAGVLAARLAGEELFPGLGPVVRVMGGSGRNSAEVMTRPHDMSGGRFSLVCEITIETLPGATWPLVYCHFKRRRWADGLQSGYVVSDSIGGFVFPHEARPKSAYRFSVLRRKGKWTTDLAYPHFEQAFDLTRGYSDERVMAYPSDGRVSAVVMLKAEVTDHSRSTLQAGVPLVDQADAFERITNALHGLGLRPFTNFRAVRATAVQAPPLSMLKAEVTLARLLERHAFEEGGGVSAEEALVMATAAPVDRWFRAGVPVPDPEHDRVIRAIRALTAHTAFPLDTTRQALYIVARQSDDIEWIKTTAHAMLGDSLTMISVPLPSDTHGPQTELPRATESAKQRFQARMGAWLKLATDVAFPPRAMILVQAPLYYDVGGPKVQRDDVVNKLAARKALAGEGCTVQYLLPSDRGRLERFLPRVQAALLDLIFGHAGSVWGLEQACKACFDASSPAPRWVSAISSLVVQTKWDRPQSVFVATKLDCSSGQAWVRFAHQGAEPVQTDWMRFDEGAHYLVRQRVELPKTWSDQSALLAQFFERTFDHLAALDPNAVVFIDSTRAARLASWLSDKGVREQTRTLAPGIVAGARWPTLRLLRIREQSPAIGQEKRFDEAAPDGQTVRTWTSTQRLFQVDGTAAPTFWSLARPTTHHKRGASCYRETYLPNSHRTPDKPGAYTAFPAQPDKQHLNSRAVEIVILQKQALDDDIRLVSFAQHLRAGMLTARNERWVMTPSPLRIIDKLAQYLKA